jgi:hypothetical protein
MDGALVWLRRAAVSRPARTTKGGEVLRKVDGSGSVSFAGVRLPGWQPLPCPDRRCSSRGRHRPNHARRRGAANPQSSARQKQGVRSAGKPHRTTTEGSRCRIGTGADSRHGYRVLTDVSGHRADMSRDILPRSARSAVGLVVPARVQAQLTDQLAVLGEHSHPKRSLSTSPTAFWTVLAGTRLLGRALARRAVAFNRVAANAPSALASTPLALR